MFVLANKWEQINLLQSCSFRDMDMFPSPRGNFTHQLFYQFFTYQTIATCHEFLMLLIFFVLGKIFFIIHLLIPTPARSFELSGKLQTLHKLYNIDSRHLFLSFFYQKLINQYYLNLINFPEEILAYYPYWIRIFRL